MEVRFEDDDLDRLEIDARFDGKLPQGVVRSYRKAMQFIRAAGDQRDLRTKPGWHLEKYRAKPGQFSLRLNDQYRLIVEFGATSASRVVVIVAITDYH